MKPKISLVTLAVADFDRALRFYRDGLGLPMHDYEEGQDVAFFRLVRSSIPPATASQELRWRTTRGRATRLTPCSHKRCGPGQRR